MGADELAGVTKELRMEKRKMERIHSKGSLTNKQTKNLSHPGMLKYNLILMCFTKQQHGYQTRQARLRVWKVTVSKSTD